jgi:serine/threonine protein kinase
VAGFGRLFTCWRRRLCRRLRWQAKKQERKKKFLPELAEWRLAALSPELQLLDGTLLDDRFKVGRLLARGGFATVTEGRDLQQGGMPCAIKIFRRELMDKEWMARRFQHEVRALAKIHHPNVVRIYGHGTISEGIPYLVMEFVDGRTLREILEAGPMPVTKTAEFLLQVGSALEAIHSHGICHRDLKPENLMVRTAAAPGQELVVIDFSIAIVKDPDETLHGLSRAAGTIILYGSRAGHRLCRYIDGHL